MKQFIELTGTGDPRPALFAVATITGVSQEDDGVHVYFGPQTEMIVTDLYESICIKLGL